MLKVERRMNELNAMQNGHQFDNCSIHTFSQATKTVENYNQQDVMPS